MFKNKQKMFILSVIENYSRIDSCIKDKKNNLPCPFDSRFLFGTSHFDKKASCSCYCLKEVLDFLPELRQKAFKCAMAFNKPKEKIERVFSLDEEKEILGKIKEKTEINPDEDETDESKELKRNMVCVYGNNDLPFPIDLLDPLLNILPGNMNIVENKSSGIFSVWDGSNYIMKFSLYELSVGISYYKSTLFCYITKGDNISLIKNKSSVVFRAKYSSYIYGLANKMKDVYNTPAQTEKYELLTKNRNVDNLICSSCSLKDVCFGCCPYRRIAYTLMEGAVYDGK